MVESVISVMAMVSLAVLGAVLGSFMMAQVWRIRARQLVADKAEGEKVDAKELKRLLPLTKDPVSRDRSRCLNCKHLLAWYDLIPVASWVFLGGRCRYCRHPIGVTELCAEVGLAALFVVSYLVWPVSVLESGVQAALFGIWIAGCTLLTGLFIYDLRWYLLPDIFDYPFIIAGILFAGVSVATSPDWLTALWSVGGSVAILGGLYGVLHLVSRGAWVGLGDVKLGIGLGLFLVDWRLGFVALFAANLLGTLIVVPGLLRGKLARDSKVPFGPLLIGGFILTWLFAPILTPLFELFTI